MCLMWIKSDITQLYDWIAIYTITLKTLLGFIIIKLIEEIVLADYYMVIAPHGSYLRWHGEIDQL